jgi:hypothetical protein
MPYTPPTRPACPEPFALATDAPGAPPVRVRALEALPFPLVRRVVWTAPEGATEPIRRVLVVRTGPRPPG